MELFKSDLKKRFDIELKEEQPSSLVGSIGYKEVKFDIEKTKESIYRNLSIPSDIKKKRGLLLNVHLLLKKMVNKVI